MVSEHNRYIRDSKSQDDKQQGRFDQHGWLQKPQTEVKIEFTTASSNEMVMCPFCLYKAKLSLFFVSTNKGISQAKAFCPECKNGMMMKSLWNEWGAKEYAKWVFGYRQSGFWKKCPFDVWKKRLHEIGWAHEFWTTYKTLKGQESTDSIFDDAERMARDYGIDIKEAKASQNE